MPAYVETMAYAGAAPWHKLGVPVSSDMTPEQMQEAAGLDWRIQRRFLGMRASNGGSEIVPVPGYCAIVRDRDSYVYQVATEAYHPIQNRDVLAFFRDFCAVGNMTMETAGSLKHGAVVWALAKMSAGRFTLPGGDSTEAYMLLANSHDSSMTFQGFTTGIRVVCSNTLSAAVAGRDGASTFFSLKHTRKVTPAFVSGVKTRVGAAIESMRRLEELAGKLANARVKDSVHIMEFAARLVQPALLLPSQQEGQNKPMLMLTAPGTTPLLSEGKPVGSIPIHWTDLHERARQVVAAVRNSPGAQLDSSRGTWWGVVNGFTYWADHQANGDDRDARLTSAWFGARAHQKRQAVELATQFAAL